MKLSTKSRYGTRLIVDIALHQQGGPVRIQDIADRQKISVKYLERIVQLLRKAGFIRSKRGQKGGHMLAMEPGDVTVGNLIRALEEDPVLVDCVASDENCRNASQCLTRRVWKEASDAMYRQLDAVTLAELIACGRANMSHGEGPCPSCGDNPAQGDSEPMGLSVLRDE